MSVFHLGCEGVAGADATAAVLHAGDLLTVARPADNSSIQLTCSQAHWPGSGCWNMTHWMHVLTCRSGTYLLQALILWHQYTILMHLYAMQY